MVPNLFRRLLGEGALTAAFVPIIKEKERQEGDPAVWRATNAVLWGLILVSVALIALVCGGLTVLVVWVPMTLDNELILRLLRVMFPYLGLVCVAALFIGILNARGHFFLPAMGATMLNVVMIASVIFLAPLFGVHRSEQVFGLAVGVLIAGVVQASFQLPVLRREGFRLQWVNPWQDPTVREVIRRMAPAVLGVAAYQINVVIVQGIAWFGAPEQTVASFNYAVRLLELPQGVVGVSLATVMLTELSKLAVAKKYPEFRGALREGLLQILFINTLAMVILWVLAEPIIRLLFERNAFDSASTSRATFALVCLAPALLAFSLNNVMARAFYALGDTVTPMRISVFCLAVNLGFAVLLIPTLHQGGMGLANSLSATINSGLLFYAFKKKQPKFEIREWLPNLGWISLAAGFAGVTAYGSFMGLDAAFGHEHLGTRALGVFVPMTLAGTVYFGIAWFLRLPQAHEIVSLVTSRFSGKK
jgi:putative peptidoglycan lipid II flippase